MRRKERRKERLLLGTFSPLMREEGEKIRGRNSTRKREHADLKTEQNTKLRCELIISLPGNYLFPLDYRVVVKLSENNCPQSSPEWKTVY